MTLPADGHVHSEWSWDTGGPNSLAAGRMREICSRAVEINLPAIIFTEHLDFPRTWRSRADDLMDHQKSFLSDDNLVDHPAFEPAGYLAAIEEVRREFPSLTILTGVEFGQPHVFEAEAMALIDFRKLDRINGSLHTLDMGGARAEPATLYGEHPAQDVVWAYLEEIPKMVDGSYFQVFTHIDYAARAWPAWRLGPFDPRQFESGYRVAMRAIANSGRALEMNTGRLWSWVPQWWSEEGGRSVTFGSDAHTADAVGRNFPEAVAMLDYFGFRPGPEPWDFWVR